MFDYLSLSPRQRQTIQYNRQAREMRRVNREKSIRKRYSSAIKRMNDLEQDSQDPKRYWKFWHKQSDKYATILRTSLRRMTRCEYRIKMAKLRKVIDLHEIERYKRMHRYYQDSLIFDLYAVETWLNSVEEWGKYIDSSSSTDSIPPNGSSSSDSD